MPWTRCFFVSYFFRSFCPAHAFSCFSTRSSANRRPQLPQLTKRTSDNEDGDASGPTAENIANVVKPVALATPLTGVSSPCIAATSGFSTSGWRVRSGVGGFLRRTIVVTVGAVAFVVSTGEDDGAGARSGTADGLCFGSRGLFIGATVGDVFAVSLIGFVSSLGMGS